MRYQPIENYGVIGDLHSAALVGMDGSIDFMCFPRFDSPTIYGELLDSVYIYNKLEPISYDFWKNLVQLIDWVCDHWRQPDYGIWEVRGGAYPFLYSRVMCWVAIDRGVRLAQRRSLPAPWDRWIGTCDEIYTHIYEDFWDAELGTFVQFQGSKAVDASALVFDVKGD
jgi:GH15 family glucan-1,4-alpha-glucosidase